MSEILPISRPIQQECFSQAFLFAVAAAAGCATGKANVDDDSIDWTLSCKLKPRRPKLDVQLKSTIRNASGGEFISYDLKRKNYDDLIATELSVPRILVLVIVPDSISDWISLTTDELLLRHCAYWISLRGQPEVENLYTVVVSVPRTNLFTAEALRRIMHSVNDGDEP